MKKRKNHKLQDKKRKRKISEPIRQKLSPKKKEKNRVRKTESKKITRTQKTEKSPKIIWLEGLLFFLIFIASGLLFLLVYKFLDFNQAEIDSIETTNYASTIEKPEPKNNLVEEDQKIIIPEEELKIPEIDTADWKSYSNSWYGFALKYPPNWKPPVAVNPTKVSRNNNANGNPAPENWEKKYFFARPEGEYFDSITGFDVFIYDIAKVNELRNTNQFPLVKPSFSENPVSCNLDIEGHLVENEEFSAEEIYVPLDDKCLENTFYFFLTGESYILNLVPHFEENYSTSQDIKRKTAESLPDFFGVATTLELIDIKRPAPKPKITAPMPVSFKIVNGRMVCDKKNDKPSKSKKTKHKHLDMECCLDPNEYPNPHCYYDPAKYGKYLK